jgi:cysteine desulfuration protein SufE
MKTLTAIEKEIIDEFQELPDIDAKYAYLFQLGDHLPPMNPAMKTDANLVKGCQSKLWFWLHQEDGRFYLEADSDSMVIKGIAALLIRLIDGRSGEELANLSIDFIDEIKIWKLASGRNTGLMAMLDHIHHAVQVQPQVPNSTKIGSE